MVVIVVWKKERATDREGQALKDVAALLSGVAGRADKHPTKKSVWLKENRASHEPSCQPTEPHFGGSRPRPDLPSVHDPHSTEQVMPWKNAT